MILIKKNKLILSLLVMLAITFYSCSEEYIEESEIQNNTEYEFNNTDSDSKSCDLNLTNNSCEFTSGEGKVAASYNTMITLLNNCHTESLDSNCTFKNVIRERVLSYKFIITHCNSAAIMNYILDSIENNAKSNRPNSSFLVVGYELVSANNTFDGYFRLKIRVIYRKKICSLSGTPELPTIP